LKFRLVALQEIKIINESIPLSALKSLPDEVKPFLKPSPYIESDSPEIAAIASSMLQGTTTINFSNVGKNLNKSFMSIKLG
jgi:hypothetical protein